MAKHLCPTSNQAATMASLACGTLVRRYVNCRMGRSTPPPRFSRRRDKLILNGSNDLTSPSSASQMPPSAMPQKALQRRRRAHVPQSAGDSSVTSTAPSLSTYPSSGQHIHASYTAPGRRVGNDSMNISFRLARLSVKGGATTTVTRRKGRS